MKQFKYVLLGSGVVAGYAAQEFAQQKTGKGQVAIVTADETIPYDRPPLSKQFLAGEAQRKDILINDASFYKKHGIEVLTNHPVVKVDLRQKKLRCKPGGEIRFEKLLIATGSEVRTLKVPGADLKNIFYLRLLRDSEAIRKQIKKDARAVVIGSGFIGMEVASVLARKGVKTTMVFRGGRVWESFFTPAISGFFQDYYRKRGVSILTEDRVIGFHGKDTLEEVELESGERLPADFVVAGIGVEPATSLFEGTGLKLDDGIVVNEFLETSIPNVWAAGDVARFPDAVFGKQRRIEHWDNAVEQGRVAVRNMIGRPQPFIHVSYFFSDEFDLSWEFWGDTEEHDEVVYRGDLKQGKFSAWWLNKGRLMAALVLDRPEEERVMAPKWIMQCRVLNPAILRNEKRSLAELETKDAVAEKPELTFV